MVGRGSTWWLRPLPFLASSILLVGCGEYLDRKETVTLAAGNAVQQNIVVHMIDPWPVHARNRDIPFSGERMANVARRYSAGPSSGASSGSGSNGGPCNAATDRASDDSICGGRAASERPGGRP